MINSECITFLYYDCTTTNCWYWCESSEVVFRHFSIQWTEYFDKHTMIVCKTEIC